MQPRSEKLRVLRAIWDWLDERLSLAPVTDVLLANLRKPVPSHVNWLFTLGAALLVLFAFQFMTGVLLMVYYKPSAAEAYASVEHISGVVPFGWFFRSLHNWGSHLIIIVALLHMVRVFVFGGYKKPRELTWILGVLILGVILAFGFTGYLLPWDQVAYWGTVVATEASGSVPIFGALTRDLMIGGTEVDDATIGRFFVLHVFVLPLLLLGLVALHLALIRIQGISSLRRTDESEPTSEEIISSGGKPFFPHHFLKDATTMYVTAGVLVTLALLSPTHLGDPADPLRTPLGIKPEWYLLPAYQLFKYVPEVVGVLMPPLLMLALILLPLLIDRSPERQARRRKRVVVGAAVIAIFVIALGILGYLSETTQTVFGVGYHFDLLGIPHALTDADGR